MNRKKGQRGPGSGASGLTTIQDVATRAEVSVATVSHVVNSSRTVSPETRERVLAAVAELRYRPDSIARSLRRSKTGTIGVIVSDITNPFFADLVRGIGDAMRALDPQLTYILSNTDEDSRKERLYLDILLDRRVDGLIIAPVGGGQSHFADILARRIPTVFVDRIPTRIDADMVVVDNLAGARRIVDHVIRLGRRRIALLVAKLDVSSIDERAAGYRQSLAENAIAFDPELVFESPSAIEPAYAAGRRALSSVPRPDAVFCTNNFMTLGMIRAVRAMGLQCPEDVAIAGFDDFPWADYFDPKLTTVAMPSFRIGEEAARLLLDRINDRRAGPPVKIVLGTELVIRESCGERLAAPRQSEPAAGAAERAPA